MNSYPIHELEKLTGIKAHTIRIWEKRFGLITPMRSDTNRRRYSEQQVRKLLNVSTLLSRGMRISQIAALTDGEINASILSGSHSDYTHTVNGGYVNDLVKCMLAYDEAGFEQVSAAVFLRYGFYEGVLTVIYPFLKQAGLLWSASEAAPAQEHFASNIIRRKILSAIDGLVPPSPEMPLFLLFLPEGEWHEIGLLMAYYLVRAKGRRVVYLGQNLPTSQLNQAAKVLKPSFVLTFYTLLLPAAEIEARLGRLAEAAIGAKLLIAGSPTLIQGTNLPNGTVWLSQVEELTDYL